MELLKIPESLSIASAANVTCHDPRHRDLLVLRRHGTSDPYIEITRGTSVVLHVKPTQPLQIHSSVKLTACHDGRAMLHVGKCVSLVPKD